MHLNLSRRWNPQSLVALAHCLLIVWILAACTSTAAGELMIEDHFDGPDLDPAWQVAFEEVTGWTYELSNSQLTATDITLTSVHGEWSRVILSQPFRSRDDFVARATVAWDAFGQRSAMQNVAIALRDHGGEAIARAWYHDAWDQNRGRISASIGKLLYQGPNDLPHLGAGTFEIRRDSGQVSITWEGNEILTGASTSPLKSLEIVFAKAAWPTATFGTLSIGHVSLEGEMAVAAEVTTWGRVKALYP